MFKGNCMIFIFLVATVISFPLEEEERKPGYCRAYGLDIKEGPGFVPAPVGHCEKIQCGDADHNAIMSLTCAAFQYPPDCYEVPIDLSKVYPKCCNYAVCPGDPEYVKQ